MEKDTLSSWKEISDYLKHSRSTCQRWEVELGLPIHRIDGTPKARVFAYKQEIDRWILDKQHLDEFQTESDLALRRRKTRNCIIAASAVLALVAAAIVLWRIIPARMPPVPEINPSVVILRFENLARDPSLDAWRIGLPQLLATDLIQSRYIKTVPPEKVSSLLRSLNLSEAEHLSEEDLGKIAVAAKADYVVSGSLMKGGNRILVTCTLQESSTGEVLSSFKHEFAREDDIFLAVDALTKEIKQSVNLSARLIAADIDKKIMAITTRSPEAYRLYCQGAELAALGRNPQAISYFERAVALDPHFAVAYQGLFAAHSFLGHSEANKYLEKAFELSDRTSERARLLIEGNYYEVIEGNFLRALEAYEKMVDLYPDDTAGYVSSARLYLDNEDWDRVIVASQKLIQLDRQSRPSVYTDLSQAYAAKGLYDKAESLLDDFLNNLSSRVLYVNNRRIFLYLVRRQFDSALSMALRTQALYPDIPSTSLLIAMVYQIKGDFAASEKELLTGLEQSNPQDQYNRRLCLASLYFDGGRIGASIDELKKIEEMGERFTQDLWKTTARAALSRCYRILGDYSRAFEEIDAACRKDDKTRNVLTREVLQRAEIILELGRLEEFDRQTEIIRGLIERDPNQKNMRFYHRLRGLRALKGNTIPRAIDHFEKALEMLPFPYGDIDFDDQAQFFDSLAQAHQQAGSLAKAADMYEKITLLTTGRFSFGDVYARSFYHLGKIFEKQGLKGKANDNYRKFLDLWKDADPIFEEVKEAKRRLEALNTAE